MKRYKEIEVSNYAEMLSRISSSKEIDLMNFDLLIYCGGGQDKKYYKEISKNTNFELLWSGWPGPKWTKFLSFIPGQAGLIKILDLNVFSETYYELSSCSVSDALYIPKRITSDIFNEAKSKTWAAKFESYILKSNGSFMITSETDETIIRKGKEYYHYDYCFGESVSETLKSIVEGNNWKT